MTVREALIKDLSIKKISHKGTKGTKLTKEEEKI
jgi:hypothetical protein